MTINNGQYYSPIGGDKYAYRTYAAVYRWDTYAKMDVDAWYQNVFYTNSKQAFVSYKYDEYFYNYDFIRMVTQSQYQKWMAEHYTILFGVDPVWPLTYMDYDVTWQTSSSNPFN